MNETLVLIGRRWEILEKLSEREHYVTELAEELGKKLPEASVQLRELLEEGLVELGQRDGDRRKFYSLSTRGERIYKAVAKASAAPDEPGLEGWRIEESVNTLLDGELDERLRASYSRALVKLCSDHPSEVVEVDAARKLLEGIASDPPGDVDVVLRELRAGLTAVVTHLAETEERGDWVWGVVYSSMMEHAKRNIDSGRETLPWALRTIGGLAGVSGGDRRKDVQRDLLELYFGERTREDGEASRVIVDLLRGLFSRSMFTEARTRAKDRDPVVRRKAARLLHELTDCLTSERP